MAVRTKQLAVGKIVTHAAYEVVYTCPPGCVTIMKDITLFNGHGASSLVIAGIGPGTSGINVFETLTAFGFLRVTGFFVLAAGDEYNMYTALGDDELAYWISGAELVL